MDTQNTLPKEPLKGEFTRLYNIRSTINDQAEDYAGWTLPYLFTDEDENTEQQHDFQSVGAQAVNHLANKMAKTLFPTGRPFFRMDLSKKQRESLEAQGLRTELIDTLLSGAEKESMKKMATAKMRSAILAALKNLIVIGNSLMYFPKDTGTRTVQVYNFRDFVIERDVSGNMKRLITRDNHLYSTLPEKVRNLIALGDMDSTKDPNRKCELFTCVCRRTDGRFDVWQEIDSNVTVPGSKGIVTEKDLSWIPLTWNLPRGQNYGNGLVEEYAGDFHTLSSLSEALLVLSGLVSDIKILVNPMGSTDVDTLNDSESGTYVYGSADDISFLQLEKFQDMKFLREQMQDYERRIGAGFLYNTATVRDAERVTAEEIRMMANELEGSFGGVYSRLAEEMQMPIARRIIIGLDEGFRDVEPMIVTGVESLSRTSELDEMMQFFNDLAMLANLPEQAAERMDFNAVIAKLGQARSIDYETLLLSEEKVKANRQERMEEEQAAANKARAAANVTQPPQTI